jgi:Mg-chelatase subunit ChlI
VRSRQENPRRTLLDQARLTPQLLDRGSSVTHNSLVANQRTHISLIDRRQDESAASPIALMRYSNAYDKSRETLAS